MQGFLINFLFTYFVFSIQVFFGSFHGILQIFLRLQTIQEIQLMRVTKYEYGNSGFRY